MSAAVRTPLLERVETFMRESTGAQEQADVVKAFASEPVGVVRLSLGALRKQQVLDGWTENGKMFYIWRSTKTAKAAIPLRQAGTGYRTAPAPGVEKVMLAMQDGKDDQYTFAEVVAISGLSEGNAKKHLQALVNEGKVFADGATKARRYSLKPFGKEPATRPKSQPAPATKASDAQRLLTFLTEIDRPLTTAELADLSGWQWGKVELELRNLEVLGFAMHEVDGDHSIWHRMKPPYPVDRKPPEATTPAPEEPLPVAVAAHAALSGLPPTDVDKPSMLALLHGPEVLAAITSDCEIILLDGSQKFLLPRRQVRAIARLIRRLDEAGILDG